MQTSHLQNRVGYFSKLFYFPVRHSQHSFTTQGKYNEAELLYVRATEIQAKVLGPEHPDLASTLANRAGLLKLQVRGVRHFSKPHVVL